MQAFKISKVCPVCKNEFRVKPSHFDKRVYCSKPCMSEAYRHRMQGQTNPNYRDAAKKLCQTCGAAFSTYMKQQKFCSVKCRAAESKTNHSTVTCEACGEAFSISPNNKAHAARRFCSPKCSLLNLQSLPRKTGRSSASRTERTCIECGQVFRVLTSELKHRACLYCSHSCSGKANARRRTGANCNFFKGTHRTKPCVVCGVLFASYDAHNKLTCSKECSREFQRNRQLGEKSHRWQGGKTDAVMLFRCSLDYSRWREQVFKRDDYSCQMCGARGGRLTAHHIKMLSEHSDLALEPWNGITLCWPCHTSIRQKESEYETRFFAITRKAAEPAMAVDNKT